MRFPEPERRAHPRYRLDAMYTSLVAHHEEGDESLVGHAYDISQGGVRIELDEPITEGTHLFVDLTLPGAVTGIQVCGEVVWVADVEDDPGPRRMALSFSVFRDQTHLQRLVSYLDYAQSRNAA